MLVMGVIVQLILLLQVVVVVVVGDGLGKLAVRVVLEEVALEQMEVVVEASMPVELVIREVILQ
jgi:hypothetical protein